MNNAEKLSLFTLAFVLYTGTFFVSSKSFIDSNGLINQFSGAKGSRTDTFLLVVDLIIGIVFLIYCLYIAVVLVRRKFFNLRNRIWKALEHEQPQSTYLQKLWRKFAERFIDPPLDQNHIRMPTIPTEIDLNNSKLEKQHYDISPHNNKQIDEKCLPHTLQFIDDVRSTKLNRQKSNSVDYNEESTSNIDGFPVLSRHLNNSDDIVRIASIRGTRVELLNSRNDSSIFTRNTPKNGQKTTITIPSRVLDTEEEGIYRLETPTGHSAHERGRFRMTMDDLPTATFKKSTLEDNRFKDISKVQIRENNDKQTTNEANSWIQNNESKEPERILSLYDIIAENQIEPGSAAPTFRDKDEKVDDMSSEDD